MSTHIRHGRGSVRPYLYGPPELLDLVIQTFGATVLERTGNGASGEHVELAIGDSVLVIETGRSFPTGPTRASIYVYVPDVDAAYARALANGATSLAAPVDKPYAERACSFVDMFGNTWHVSSYVGD
jgi:PhnB protein